MAKTQDIYEKLYPQTIELRKIEENRFKKEEARCETLKKTSLVQGRKYFPRYLNQIKYFINSAKNCVLNGDYNGIRDLNKILLKMIDIVAFREIPIFSDWFVEYAFLISVLEEFLLTPKIS